jgi:hypothetical protein
MQLKRMPQAVFGVVSISRAHQQIQRCAVIMQ